MKGRWLFFLAALTLVGAVVAVTAISATTQEPSSAFDSAGNAGAASVSDLRRDGYDVRRTLGSPTDVLSGAGRDVSRTLVVVMNASTPYQPEEVQAVRSFLMDGGRLLVADNFGQANSLTASLGVSFERVRLVESEVGPALARIDGVDYAVPMTSPTALWVDSMLPVTVVAASSNQSFLDRDGDGIITAGEPLGPFPLIVDVTMGAQGGRIVAIADSSPMFSDGAHDDVQAFRSALVSSLLPTGGVVLVDESRQGTSDPWLLAAATLTGAATRAPWNWLLAGFAGAALIASAAASRPRWGHHVFRPNHFRRRAQGGLNRTPGSPLTVLGGPAVAWTRRGLAAVIGGVATAILAIGLGSPAAAYTAAFLLLAATFALLAQPAPLTVGRRVSADRTTEGGSVTVDLALHGTWGRARHVEVLDSIPPDFDLAAGHNWFQTWVSTRPKTATYQVTPALRGPHEVGPLRLQSSDPFRLRIAESRVSRPSALVVHPRKESLARMPFRSMRPMMTLGPHLVNRAGDGSEFHALRGYRQGDSIRSVNWKASARSKELVVNQRVHESMARILIILDARAIAAAGPAGRSPINQGCRAAFSIAAAAHQARDRVRFFVYGDGVQELAADTGAQFPHELSNALAALEATGQTTLKEALPGILPSLSSQSPVIVISGMEADPGFYDAVLELRRRGGRPYVLSLEIGVTPEEDDEGPEEPDAQLLKEQHDAATAALRAAGVPTLATDRDTPLALLMRLGVL